jgi:hypothetical protein
MENATPMSMQPSTGPLRKASANLSIWTLSLPIVHRDMAREGIEQVDVTVGVVDGNGEG